MRKILKKLTISILIIINYNTYSQNTLTKNQINEDFNQFVDIIEKCNPQLPIRKAVTGFDQIKEIRKFRKGIDTISCLDNFFQLLNNSLVYLMDPHTTEKTNFLPKSENLSGMDTIAMKERENYYKSNEYMLKSKINTHKYLPIHAFYYDDNYYLKGEHKFISRDKVDTININLMKLISYNGKDISKYFSEKPQEFMFWDYDRKKFYCGLNWGISFPREGVFKGEQDGKIIEFNIEDYPFANLCSATSVNLDSVPIKENYFGKKKKVEFFSEDSILYIYLDKMNVDTVFFNNIKVSVKGKKINKIIIDIRGNGGGGDECWNNLLSCITKDTLPYNIKLAVNYNEMVLSKIKGFEFITYVKKIKWLGSKKYGIIEANLKIAPDTNSLKYNGKIYVLSDHITYSAAFSLVNYADQVDNIISIGCPPTGQIYGFGIIPQLFQLKHSKYSFRMPIVIDILNANKPEDVYKDKPKIIVYPTIEEKLLYPSSKYDTKSKEFLYKYDSWFKKVLELN